MYSLVRESDGAGDSGPMSVAFWEGEDEGYKSIYRQDDARPRVGVSMRVGSPYARTYQHQDWWQTTYVTEILEDTPTMVKFKTRNSTYVWKCT